MATIYRVFNAKNQLVNSERIHRLFRHFSNYYSGVIGYQYNGVEYLSDSHMDDIISYNNTSKKITIQGDYIQFLIRGMSFMMSHPTVQAAYPRTGQTELSRNWLADSNDTVIAPKTNYVYKLMSASSSYAANTWFYWDGDKYVKKDSFDGESNNFYGPKTFNVSDGYNLLGLVVNVDNIENSSINTITHHRIHTADSIAYNSSTASSNTENFGFYFIKGFDIEFNTASGLYKIKKKNDFQYSTDWSSGYRFNALKFNNLQVEGISDKKSGYLIPVAAMVNGQYVRLLECHSKSSLEDFLTQTAINKLKSDLDSKYVWQGNCTDNTQSKGKIGDLIISKNHISGAGNTKNLYVDTYRLYLEGAAQLRKDYDAENKVQHKAWSSSNAQGLPLILYENGFVWPARWITIEHGGTGADNKADARKKLGIFSGKTLPADSNSNYENGDIFLKIIE